MLGVFLNRCAKMREIREDSVFQRFLDPNASWVPLTQLPLLGDQVINYGYYY